ncbi:MAG: hypothetical protein GY777_05130, partial [Candidatus Brocadiaceae bacterium]|nr:hypothetical protein [Candidatus Brocadiaceae bacterium]
MKLISIFNIVDFEHRNENREDWLNIDTIRISFQIIYIVISIYYKNATEFFSNRKQRCGAGGSVKGGTIILQGDHCQTILDEITKQGYNAKIAG